MKFKPGDTVRTKSVYEIRQFRCMDYDFIGQMHKFCEKTYVIEDIHEKNWYFLKNTDLCVWAEDWLEPVTVNQLPDELFTVE